jgi:hypothetical protein
VHWSIVVNVTGTPLMSTVTVNPEFRNHTAELAGQCAQR